MTELDLYPLIFKAKYKNGRWSEEYTALDACTGKEESMLTEEERQMLLKKRNESFGLPTMNLTNLYGYSVFEGGKAFTQPDGSVKLFRPEENGSRMAASMQGLKMVPAEAGYITESMRRVIGRNFQKGFFPAYDKEWEKSNFINAKAIYIRPFTYAAPNIWPVPDAEPWLVVTAMEVGALFDPSKAAELVVSDRIRAIRGGTGWIKCTANYTVSILAKQEAVEKGFSDALFLDAEQRRYIEEGSVSNFFAVMKNGEFVTPALTDTILPGITRKSIIELAPTLGLKVVERPLELEEVLNNAVEAFACGTAAVVSPIGGITDKSGKRYQMGSGKMGEITTLISKTYRGIQYGLLEDKLKWMVDPLF
jgi:branched-chain amino acid aminotransferase